MVLTLCHLRLMVNHALDVKFYVANMSNNAIRENKILAKISEFTLYVVRVILRPYLLT